MGLLSSKNSKIKQAYVLLLGLDSAGKSTLLYKLKLATDITTMPTIGFNVEMIELESSLLLTVWDVGGQEKMRTVWSYYCENADGLVYVVDSTDQQRLEVSRKEIFKVKKLCSDRNWYVQPCCALTGDGLIEGFRKLTGFMKSHIKSRGDTLAFFKQK
uniref:ADP-ribosylation factor-like protein 14 n=1 Tax=Spermophilus dauricus TaxID=99837 RepID=A0A8C9PFD2_SPEDA